MYPPGQPVGKSTVQIGRQAQPTGGLTGSDSETYDKWSQALASACDLVKASTLPEANRLWTAILPTLIVSDETLWAVDYDAAGNQVCGPTRRDRVQLYVGRQYQGPEPHHKLTVTHLEICTEAGFAQFLKSLKIDQGIWARMFPVDED